MNEKFIAGIEDKYPAPLLKGRNPVEGNVLACFFRDPLLLDETKCKKEDFITESGRFYFQLLCYLRAKGLNAITEADIAVLEESKPDVYEKYVDLGRITTINHIIESVTQQNFDAYIDILLRENILLKMYDDGFNLLEPITTSDGKQRVPLKILRKMNAEGVIDWWESRLSTYGDGYSKRVIEEETIEFTDEFIDQCIQGEENGVPFDQAGEDINGETMNCFKFLSTQLQGLLPGTLSMIGGFSSTGKSTWLITLMMALLYRERKIILISNEESIKKYKIKILVWLLAKYRKYFHLTKKKLTAGEITDEAREELREVQEYWLEHYKDRLKLITINDADMSIIKKKIREYALREGYDTFIYDTFKIEVSNMNKDRTDLSLVKDSRELDKLAKKYNMIGIASIQLAEYLRGTLWLGANAISGAKQVKEILENLVLMRNVYQEELDPKSKFYINPFRLTMKDDVWVEEPYLADPTWTWRILFVNKSRSGENSDDNGRAYLIRYQGDFAMFKETCQCRPKHGKID